MAVSRPALRLLALGLLGYVAVTAASLAMHHPDSSRGGGGTGSAVIQVGAALSLAGAGAFLLSRADSRRDAVLVLSSAAAFTVAVPPVTELRSAWLFTLALVCAPTAAFLLGSVSLLWLRAPEERARLVVGAALVPAILSGLAPALFFDPARAGCNSCPDNLVQIVAAPELQHWLVHAGLITTVLWGIGLAGVGISRFVRTPRTLRPVAAPVLLGGVGVAGLAAGSSAHVLTLPTVEIDPTVQAVWLAQCLLAIVVATGIAVRPSMVRRVARRLAGQVMAATPDRESLRQVFAEAIGDPDLRLVFPTASTGEGLATDGSAAVLRVARQDTLVAELHYRRELQPATERLAAAARSAGLALEYASAQQALQREDEELRDSRQRTVETGDSARRRIERNLHDGAQQRLVALSVLAGAARRSASTPADAQTFDLVCRETAAALEELRTIARGIFPAALWDDGLVAALTELQDHSPVPLKVDTADLNQPVPAAPAMAAYRLVADTVRWGGLRPAAGSVHVSLSDDGPDLHVRLVASEMTASEATTVLEHAADRVHALGGSLQIRAVNDQLIVEAVLPCAL
jgi:signal transduction histidine kinase